MTGHAEAGGRGSEVGTAGRHGLAGGPGPGDPDAPTLPDYHTHTHRCGHAVGSAADYVDAARSKGLGGIGICDHLPLVGRRDPGLTMDISQVEDYVAEVLELKRAYPGYVLLGIEADYEPETFDEVRSLLASHPFDYVIGSVHFLDGWGFDDPRNDKGWAERDVLDVYLHYFERVGDAAGSGAFDILGHLDLVKKFGHRPPQPPTAALASLVERIARAGVAVEVNTAGLRKPVAELYPAADLLGLLRRNQVPLTFGSDAHKPEEVGADFAVAVAAARAAGYSHYAHLQTTGSGGRARISSRALPKTPPAAHGVGRGTSAPHGGLR